MDIPNKTNREDMSKKGEISYMWGGAKGVRTDDTVGYVF
jgi:hypothetical protein